MKKPSSNAFFKSSHILQREKVIPQICYSSSCSSSYIPHQPTELRLHSRLKIPKSQLPSLNSSSKRPSLHSSRHLPSQNSSCYADGRFMMRMKLPNGVTTSAQTRYLASVIKKYAKDGCADVTTRQNWLIRGVVLSDVPA